MTGLELLEGLSFVDERYIAEAEVAYLKRGTPWMKWVSAAACLCILLVGAYAYSQHGRSMEGVAQDMPAADMPAAAAPMEDTPAAEEAVAEGAPKEDSVAAEAGKGEPEAAEIPAGELQHVPGVILQVVSVTEEGFVATVGEHVDAGSLETGMQVTVVMDPEMVPGSEEKDVSANRMETELTEGMLVHIIDGAYDAGTGKLYVDRITPAE